jgi:hypothetical protein
MAVSKIIQRTQYALESLQPHGKPGRRKNNALRRIMIFLALSFYKPNLEDKDTKKKCKEFISKALSSVNISHPGPGDQRTKFNSLRKAACDPLSK